MLKKEEQYSYNFIDLFAGAGGLSEGFLQAGFKPVAHVEMNEFAAKTLTNLMRDAFQEALVCTNDPECMSNLPAGKNSNGAACHSCCMISETACENGNRMLDRGLAVPIPGREECSYFKELVGDLCQVEI